MVSKKHDIFSREIINYIYLNGRNNHYNEYFNNAIIRKNSPRFREQHDNVFLTSNKVLII